MDNNIELLVDRRGKIYTVEDLIKSLKAVKADCCDILFIHSELGFGIPRSGLKRKQYFKLIFDAIQSLGVNTLIFPTFTFSFSNYEDYDVLKSKSKMGALTEYARKLPEAVRSKDPLMSVVVIGKDKAIIKNLGKNSIGKESIFDRLHKCNNVRFLFLGTDIDQCFTHMHYIEEINNVPYRYNKKFSGNIIDEKGMCVEDTYTLYVKYRDVIPVVPKSFEEELVKQGKYIKVEFGDSTIGCFTEKDSFEATVKWLNDDINCFLDESYDTHPLVKEYKFGDVTTVQ